MGVIFAPITSRRGFSVVFPTGLCWFSVRRSTVTRSVSLHAMQQNSMHNPYCYETPERKEGNKTSKKNGIEPCPDKKRKALATARLQKVREHYIRMQILSTTNISAQWVAGGTEATVMLSERATRRDDSAGDYAVAECCDSRFRISASSGFCWRAAFRCSTPSSRRPICRQARPKSR